MAQLEKIRKARTFEASKKKLPTLAGGEPVNALLY